MVITKSVSRFARNTVTSLETVRELKLLGIDVYFEEQRIHSMSGDGELMLTILSAFAQEESKSASDNQKWRIRKGFEDGELMCLRTMFGYRISKEAGIEIDPEQAAIVREIYARIIRGDTLNSITRWLNRNGLYGSFGGKWNTARIRDLVSNEKYTGNSLLQKAYVKLIRCGLAHQLIALLFGEGLDIGRGRALGFLITAFFYNDFFRIRYCQCAGMDHGVFTDMRAVDPLLRQEHPASIRVLTDGHDACDHTVRALAPGDARHVLAVDDLISPVWRIVIVQQIEISVVADQSGPRALHQPDIRVEQVLDGIDEAAVAQADPANDIGGQDAVIRRHERFPHFGERVDHIRTDLDGQPAAHVAHEVIADMPSLHGHFMVGGIHVDGINAEALLGGLFCRNDDRAVVFQRFIGRDRRFNDPLLLKFLPAQVLRDRMHQRQAEVAARDLRYSAGRRLEDAQAVAMPECRVGFINADHRRSPPPAGHKESASEETLNGSYSS